MPRLMIDLTDDEWATLRSLARAARRTPQAQAAQLLVELLQARAKEEHRAQVAHPDDLDPGRGAIASAEPVSPPGGNTVRPVLDQTGA